MLSASHTNPQTTIGSEKKEHVRPIYHTVSNVAVMFEYIMYAPFVEWLWCTRRSITLLLQAVSCRCVFSTLSWEQH